MKKLLILFVIVFVSLNSYSQISLTKDETLQLQQIQNYPEYVKFCNEHSITPKTETAWIFDVFYLADYKLKQDLQDLNSKIISSGKYLIKARNQIISGIGSQAFAATAAYVGTIIYDNAITKATTISNNSARTDQMNLAKRNRNTIYIGAGILSLAGFGFEILGILNIGNAGISLNGNGVGVKVKF